MPPQPHDIEAEIYALPTSEGGRKNPLLSGYRPTHDFGKNGHLNDGMHDYPDGGRLELALRAEHSFGCLLQTRTSDSCLLVTPSPSKKEVESLAAEKSQPSRMRSSRKEANQAPEPTGPSARGSS